MSHVGRAVLPTLAAVQSKLSIESHADNDNNEEGNRLSSSSSSVVLLLERLKLPTPAEISQE